MKGFVVFSRAFCALTLVLLFMPQAADAGAAPSSTDPSRSWQRMEDLAPPPAPFTPAPKAEAPKAPAPEGAEETTFTLTAVSIEGMTAYPEGGMEDFYKDKINTTVSFADLFALADAMTARYRNDGYILSRVIVPPQEVDEGRVAFRAVEGFIDAVTVKSDDKGVDTAALSPYFDPVKADRPLNNATLERATLLVDDLPGITAESVLGPSPTTPGAASLTVVVKRKKLEGFAAADNRGSRFMGPLGVNAGVTLNNLLGQFESLGLSLGGTPEQLPDPELANLGITITKNIGHRGTRLNASASLSETRPAHTVSGFDDHGVARRLAVEVTHPVIRTRRSNLTLGLKLDLLDSGRTDSFGTDNSDRLRVVRATATGQFADPLGGANTLEVEASQGLNIFNASRKGGLGLSRAAGDPQFFKTELTHTRVQPLSFLKSNLWQAATTVTAQKSAHLLLASEEYGLGGAQIGSAYDSSEITGEDGIGLRAELRRFIPPGALPVKGMQTYAAYDIGKIWNPDDAVPEHRQLSLASAALGMRVQATDTISCSAEVAKPLTHRPGISNDRSLRGFFSMLARF